MSAAVLRELGKPLSLEEVDIPGQLGDNEVLVETKACGICRTDLHIIDGSGYKPKLPHILGHEPAGIVRKVGKGVNSRVSIGDRVVPNIFFTCGECYYCRTNRETLCTNFPGALGVGVNGAYAEYFKAPAKNLFVLPNNVGFPEGAVIADAVVTAVHAVRRRARVVASENVLVIGLGGIGQNLIQILKNAGATVIAVGRRPGQLELAQKLGADHLVRSSDSDVPTAVKELTNGDGVAVVMDNVGSRETLLQGVGSLRPGGRIIMIGETDDTIPLETFRLCVNEFEISGSRSGGRQDTVEAIELVADRIVTPLISDKLPLDRINEALDRVRNGQVLGRAVVTFD